MGVETDEAQWPLVTVRWEGAISDEEVTAFLVRMDGWLGRGQDFGLLLDGRGAGGLTADQRSRLVQHMKDRAAETARYLVQAVVMDNLILRTLYYGVNLIFPRPFPSRGFADVDLARKWLKSELGARATRPAAGSDRR